MYILTRENDDSDDIADESKYPDGRDPDSLAVEVPTLDEVLPLSHRLVAVGGVGTQVERGLGIFFVFFVFEVVKKVLKGRFREDECSGKKCT